MENTIRAGKAVRIMQIRLHPKSKRHYPFDELEVGDSIVVPYQRAGEETLRQVVRARHKRQPGKTFRVAPTTEGNHLIVRVT